MARVLAQEPLFAKRKKYIALQAGHRVMRGDDWMWGNQDGPYGEGEVIQVCSLGWIKVEWDHGPINFYRMRPNVNDLKLVKGPQQMIGHHHKPPGTCSSFGHASTMRHRRTPCDTAAKDSCSLATKVKELLFKPPEESALVSLALKPRLILSKEESNAVKLSWNLNLLETNLSVASYDIYYSSINTYWTKVASVPASTLPMAYRVRFLKKNTYNFMIRAIDNNQRGGKFSNIVSVNI